MFHNRTTAFHSRVPCGYCSTGLSAGYNLAGLHRCDNGALKSLWRSLKNGVGHRYRDATRIEVGKPPFSTLLGYFYTRKRCYRVPDHESPRPSSPIISTYGQQPLQELSIHHWPDISIKRKGLNRTVSLPLKQTKLFGANMFFF